MRPATAVAEGVGAARKAPEDSILRSFPRLHISNHYFTGTSPLQYCKDLPGFNAQFTFLFLSNIAQFIAMIGTNIRRRDE